MLEITCNMHLPLYQYDMTVHVYKMPTITCTCPMQDFIPHILGVTDHHMCTFAVPAYPPHAGSWTTHLNHTPHVKLYITHILNPPPMQDLRSAGPPGVQAACAVSGGAGGSGGGTQVWDAPAYAPRQ
jgi:hypothetical protein